MVARVSKCKIGENHVLVDHVRVADMHSGLKSALAKVALLGALLLLELRWLAWLLTVLSFLIVHFVLISDTFSGPPGDAACFGRGLSSLQKHAWLGVGVLMGRHAGAVVFFVGKELGGHAGTVVGLK